MNKLTSKVALIILAVISLALITANNFIFKGSRVDLTEDKTYSIAEGTKNIVMSLETDVQLKFFYSEEDSSELGFLRDYARRITDLLEEYVLRSDGKLSLQVIDPEAFSEQEDEAAEHGIQRVGLGFGEEPIFFGLVAVAANGAEENIEFLHPDREEFLEYDVTRMLSKVGRVKEQKIGLISGLLVTGGFDQGQQRAVSPWQTYVQLRQLYQIDILGVDIEDIPEDIDLLLLIHPDNVSDKTLYAIDQYALRGGSILAFVDEFAQTDPLLSMGPQMDATSIPSRFLPLLEKWGVELVADKVLADEAHALRVGGGATQRPTPHLGVFGYGQDNFVANDHPVLSQLNNIIFSSGSVIQPLPDAETTFEPLIQSSDRAGLIDASLLKNLVDPAQLANQFKATGERYTIAAHVRGPVTTAYPDGRPIAQETEADAEAADTASAEAAATAEAQEPVELLEHINETGDDGINLFIVADTDMLNDPLWVRLQNFFGREVAQPFADNGNFFINAAENILGSSDLMSLRSRGTYARPFHVVEDLERDAAARFQDKERELQERLNATEARLGELQQNREGSDVLSLSAEQQQEVDSFRAEQLTIRRELREVQHQLGQDIEKLGGWIKLLNIVLMPLIVTVVALVLRHRRSSAVRQANRELAAARQGV